MHISASGLVEYEDEKTRCFWCGEYNDYIDYHDSEWGRKVTDDYALFEKIILEGFQSGLSWLTILRKREEFRKSFKQFDFNKVADFTIKDVNRLLRNEGIVRHRGKIESVINNARRAKEIVTEFGSLYDYIQQFRPEQQNRPSEITYTWLKKHTTCEEAIRLSQDLKRRGWTYVGPTTMYAFMQSVGMVNDHIEGCDFK